MTSFRSFTLFVPAAILFCAGYANAQNNLLTNSRFENRGAEFQTVQTRSCDDLSSAKGWTTWIQAIGCVPESGVEMTTDLVLGTPLHLYSSAEYLMHVRTRVSNPLGMGDAGASGIAQTFNTNGVHNRVLASAWVYVVRGAVGMGVGFYRNTRPAVRSSTIGEWELLVGVSDRDLPTQLVVFGLDQRGSEFYVADAAVCPADTDEELNACYENLNRPTPRIAKAGK